MKRRLLNLLTVLSMLLCVVAFVLAITGLGVADTWVIEPGSGGAAAVAVGASLVATIAYTASRRRPPSGICPACGYDLTGNVSGVCPECGGTAPAPQKVNG